VTAAASTESRVSFACGGSTVSSLAPPLMNSGAPHSSTLMCAIAWQTIASVLRQIAASASELAAVPLNTKNTSHAVSNNCAIASLAARVQSSAP
jgi:hypothetical protein